MREVVPGDATLCSRVRTLLIFGEGATSSSKSPVFSALGVWSPGVLKTGFRREVGVCARLFPVSSSGGHSRKGNTRSLIDDVQDVGVEAASSIRHSGGEDGEDWCAWDFPFPEVVSRSGVWRVIGV